MGHVNLILHELEIETEDEPTQVPQVTQESDQYSLPSNWGISNKGEPMSPTAMAIKFKEHNKNRRKASSWVIGQGEGPSISLGQAAQKQNKVEIPQEEKKKAQKVRPSLGNTIKGKHDPWNAHRRILA
ncbi:hypothetical protein RSAG8_13431, partial [Rhizoctonia solani AG-8 WAC10335]